MGLGWDPSLGDVVKFRSGALGEVVKRVSLEDGSHLWRISLSGGVVRQWETKHLQDLKKLGVIRVLGFWGRLLFRLGIKRWPTSGFSQGVRT